MLDNDDLSGSATITHASAEHGLVAVVNDYLLYTPDKGYTGQDVITYEIGDKNVSDSAKVFVNIKSGSDSSKTTEKSALTSDNDNSHEDSTKSKDSHVHDQEWSSSGASGDISFGGKHSSNDLFADTSHSHSSPTANQTWNLNSAGFGHDPVAHAPDECHGTA